MSFVIQKAAELTKGERNQTYGHPSANHSRTATMWGAYLGITITARQVCMMNIMQKISRDAHKPDDDNLIDIAGYAENVGMIIEIEKQKGA